jgi:hypothetical protein
LELPEKAVRLFVPNDFAVFASGTSSALPDCESNETTKEDEVMKRSSALAIFLGTALMAGAASASAARIDDIQAPRSSSQDIQAPRTGSEDIQAPRTGNEDIQAPRARLDDIQAPRTGSEDIQAPRTGSQDIQAPRGQDIQAPRG